MSVEGVLEIKVTKAEGPKCPRCWSHNGITDNYQGICDRCQSNLKVALVDLIFDEKITEEEANLVFAEITRLERLQVEKYRARSSGGSVSDESRIA